MNHQAITLTAVVCLLSMTAISCLPTITHCSGKAANIMFVLDSSSSIWIVDYEKQLKFVEKLVEPFDIGPADSQVHVGAITFSNEAHLEFSFEEHINKGQLRKAISEIPYRQGQTNTAEALDLLRMEITSRIERATAPFIAVVITDGMSKDTKATRKEAKRLHDLGVNVFAIGVGYSFDLSELKAIASDSENNVYQVSSYSSLENIVKAFNVKTCEAIVITTQPAPSTTTTALLPTTTLPPTTTTTTEAPPTTRTSEIPQRDASSTISFGYDLATMGAYRSHMIRQFINNLLPYTGYDQFSVVSYVYCPENMNVPVTSLMNNHSPNVAVPGMNIEYKVPSFVDVVRRMRRDLNDRAIQNTKGDGGQERGSQVAVLFVDPSVTVLTPELIQETNRLKQDGSKLFLINVGHHSNGGLWNQPQYLYSMSSQPYNNYIYNYPTYEQLLYSIRHTPFQFRSMCNRYVPTAY